MEDYKNEDGKLNYTALDSLLSKYISIWLWSILFGGATGLTLTFSNYGRFSDWGSLSGVLSLTMAISIMFLIMAWFSLFSFLKTYIIPTIFSVIEDEEEIHYRRKKAAKYLSVSFSTLIMSGLMKLFIGFAQYLFSSF